MKVALLLMSEMDGASVVGNSVERKTARSWHRWGRTVVDRGENAGSGVHTGTRTRLNQPLQKRNP